MPKIKKISIIFGLFLVLFLPIFGGIAQADTSSEGNTSPAQTQSSANDATSASKACKGVANPQDNSQPTCAQCHAKGADLSKGNLKLCVCYPQYYYGSALSNSELESCQACNKPGLSYDAQTRSCLTNNQVVKVLNMLVNLLAGIAGITIIGVLILGGIRYSLAGNPQAAANARKHIINGLIALVAFLLIWAGLHWLIVSGF